MTSVEPLDATVPNKYYGYSKIMLDNRGEVFKIATAVRQYALDKYGTLKLSPAQRRDVAEKTGELKQRFLDLRNKAEAEAHSAPVMPAPPKPQQLYGRVADGVEIVDVGSGNCRRLTGQSGRLRITAVDPELDSGDVTVKRAKEEFGPGHLGPVVTSFNVISQMPPEHHSRELLMQQDGLHVIPDHERLIEMGVAVPSEEKLVCQTGQKIWHDYRVSMPGLDVSDGYLLCPTYKKEHFVLNFGEMAMGEYQPKIQASPGCVKNFDWSDLGYKWDGVPYELESDGEHCYLTGRNGSYAKIHQPMPSFVLHLEYVRDPGVYVLIRVVHWRGFIPPHTGDCLRLFAAKKIFTVNGSEVVGSPAVVGDTAPLLAGARRPVDGLIARDKELDYYVKKDWTADLDPGALEHIEGVLASHGLLCEVDRRGEGLCEYIVERGEGVVRLKYHKDRPDKLTNTSYETLLYMLTLPTLQEVTAAGGGARIFRRLLAEVEMSEKTE